MPDSDKALVAKAAMEPTSFSEFRVVFSVYNRSKVRVGFAAEERVDRNLRFLPRLGGTDYIELRPDFRNLTPQQAPTSQRIKSLLGRGLTNPETLTPDEIREMCASLVYFLLALNGTDDSKT